MRILGIETSCDETSASVVQGKKILSNVVASQAEFHAPFGGVVPEIASRHHIENLPAIIDEALAQAGTRLAEIDGIAATYTPGLLGALLVGLQYGKALALGLDKPFVGVNHLEGHLNSVFLAPPPAVPTKWAFCPATGGGVENENIEYPFLGLIVSGGHTHLYRVKEFGRYELLGATRDDACGEAFDKVAKLLGLGYPGGPRLEKTAVGGNPKAFRLTTPKLKNDSLDFSFSGVKTACLLEVQKQPPPPVVPTKWAFRPATGGGEQNLSPQFVQDLAASFQEMVTDFLVTRLRQAAKKYGLKTVVVTGGVAANQTLRKKLNTAAGEEGWRLWVPPLSLCTDNGAMIAYVGGCYLNRGRKSALSLNAVAYSELGKQTYENS